MSNSGIKQVEVQIMSQSYILACPIDGEEALKTAVSRVDQAMCRIRDAGKVKARDRIAVLAALNIAFELTQSGQPSAFRGSSFGNTESGELGEAGSGPEGPRSIDTQLQALLARLDDALAEDGRLL
jgi:cell division protein ZapA